MSAEIWFDLRQAVREAHALGATFAIAGADVEINGTPLPRSLLDRLPSDLLFQYLGADRVDREAVEFAELIGITPVLVEDPAELPAILAELEQAEFVGIDIETAPIGAKPTPVRINKDGSVAARQAEPDDAGLDPHRSEIATVQLFAGGDRVFIFRGKSLQG